MTSKLVEKIEGSVDPKMVILQIVADTADMLLRLAVVDEDGGNAKLASLGLLLR